MQIIELNQLIHFKLWLPKILSITSLLITVSTCFYLQWQVKHSFELAWEPFNDLNHCLLLSIWWQNFIWYRWFVNKLGLNFLRFYYSWKIYLLILVYSIIKVFKSRAALRRKKMFLESCIIFFPHSLSKFVSIFPHNSIILYEMMAMCNQAFLQISLNGIVFLLLFVSTIQVDFHSNFNSSKISDITNGDPVSLPILLRSK